MTEHRLRDRGFLVMSTILRVVAPILVTAAISVWLIDVTLNEPSLKWVLMGFALIVICIESAAMDLVHMRRLVTKCSVAEGGLTVGPALGGQRVLTAESLLRGFTASRSGESRERLVYCGVIVRSSGGGEECWWMFFESFERFEAELRMAFPQLPWSHRMKDVPGWRQGRRWSIGNGMLPMEKQVLPKGWKEEDELAGHVDDLSG